MDNVKLFLAGLLFVAVCLSITYVLHSPGDRGGVECVATRFGC